MSDLIVDCVILSVGLLIILAAWAIIEKAMLICIAGV